jgi:hypothetical protein
MTAVLLMVKKRNMNFEVPVKTGIFLSYLASYATALLFVAILYTIGVFSG